MITELKRLKMRLLYLFIVLVAMFNLGANPTFAQGMDYLSDSIIQLQKKAQQATRAESLEGLQKQAKEIMELAGEFQEQAQALNDMGYVNEAIDIYNSAYRAFKSSTLEEALSYARQVVSHTDIVAQQSGLFHHVPFFEEETKEENLEGSYYDKAPEDLYGRYQRNLDEYPN